MNQKSALDSYVEDIRCLGTMVESSTYLLASKLAEGESSGVWKTRLDAKQKPVYRNFEMFAVTELGLSGKYVRDLLKLYNSFTEELFKSIGPSKLRLVFAAKTIDGRAKVLDSLKGGASRRYVEREVLGWQPKPKGHVVRKHVRGGPVTIDLAQAEARLWRMSLDDLLEFERIVMRVRKARVRKTA